MCWEIGDSWGYVGRRLTDEPGRGHESFPWWLDEGLIMVNKRRMRRGAMATTVAVKPPVLEWAQRRSGRGDDDMRAKFTNWDQWLSEERQPRFAEVEAVAQFTHVTVGYLRSCRFPILGTVEEKLGCQRTIFSRRFTSINVVKSGMKTIWLNLVTMNR